MRIALIFRAFVKTGGIGKYVIELASRFVNDHEVHLLTSQYKYPIRGLNVHKFPIISEPFSAQILSNAIKNDIQISYLNYKYNFDIINSNVAETFSSPVNTAHSCHIAWIKRYKQYQKYKFLLRPVDYIVLTLEKNSFKKGNYKKIIASSSGVKREIINFYKVPDEDISVILGGVDLNEFSPNNKIKYRSDTRKYFGISKDCVTLLFVGWEYERKGLAFILKALSEIKEDNIKLLVVGSQNTQTYQKLAEKLKISNKIIFAGPSDSKSLKKFYAGSDIFVFPTDYESFSLVTLEAVASGLPILATKVNGTEELIQDGYNGFFIRRDPKDIAEKILLLASDEKLRRVMSLNAIKSAKKYSWDEVARQTLEVYEEVANR